MNKANMGKESVLKKLKEATSIKGLRLPAYLGVHEDSGVVSLTMLATTSGRKAHGVTANMQADDAAFEGWATGMKVAVPEWRFRLHWDLPENKRNGHYQRFLYRAKRFSSLYGEWFTIADDMLEELEKSSLVSDDDIYFLNRPLGDQKRTNDAEHSAENLIENTIIKTQPHDLKRIFNIEDLHRQLPVGVFRDCVTKKNAIFTHGKSAIDIWGVSGNELTIFELKAPGNRKVGAISELFFYAMVMRDEQSGLFVRKHDNGYDIRATTFIRAMLLAEDVHPLINNPGVFKLLNRPCEGRIEFGYVKMLTNYGYSRLY